MSQTVRPTAAPPWNRVAEFARTQGFGSDDTDRLQVLARTVADLLSVQGVSITSSGGDLVASTASPPPGVTDIDLLQHALGSGPGPTAISTGNVVRVEDTRDDDRWPAFLEAATVSGFRAVLAVPLELQDGPDASVCAYATSPREWSADEQATAVVLCAIVSSWTSGSQLLQEQALLVTQLQHALDSRVVIEQAKGVLATVEGVAPDEAFELMRRHARRRGIPVREVAEAVVRLDFRPPKGAPAGTTRAARGRNAEAG